MYGERPSGLAQRSLSAVFWGSGGAAARLGLQVGTQIALARILGPQQYGVFAVGATVIGLSAFLSDIGLAYGLIQKREVEAEDIRFVFTWQVVLGMLVTAGVYLAAEPVASFFGEPRAAAALQAMSVLCLLNALAATSLNLLKRRLDFRAIQLAQIASYGVGYVVCGLSLALAGAGYWALVSAWAIQAAVNGALLYRATRHAVRPLVWYPQARTQGRYALTVLATNLTNWLVGNIDRVVVGRVFGSWEIGLYATFYNLLYAPAAMLLGVVQPVFFSASARISDEPQRIAQGYRTLVATVALFALPAFATVAVLAESFVLALYGPAWQPAAALMTPLALAMPLFLLFGLTTPLLWTSGRAPREFLLQLPLAALWLAASLLAATVSLPALAWTVLALFVLRAFVVVHAALRAMQLGLAELWRAARAGVAVSIACMLAAALPGWALPADAPRWLVLVSGGSGAAAVWLASIWSVPGMVEADALALFAKLAGRLPPWAARCWQAVERRQR